MLKRITFKKKKKSLQEKKEIALEKENGFGRDSMMGLL